MQQNVYTNHELQLAKEFVHFTDYNIFLTGKAGTGKTTFLHSLDGSTPKRMVVAAPTGVAAINAGGVTLHSLFQLPIGPFFPGSEAFVQDSNRQFRFSKEKKKIIQSLDLLIIDEISMVRADILDAVDLVLRRHRMNSAPFGGVQLLMIGDLHQLPPVVKQDEWELLQDHYETPFFFSSKALNQTRFITIELKHIFRQSDPQFIDLLNRVRDNCLDDNTISILNQRYIQNFTPADDHGYIILTTHNRSAQSINFARLNNLHGRAFTFQARVSNDFPEHTYPVPDVLELKKGAQVMFVRNDSGPEKMYFNGKTGAISKISDKEISVVCPGEDREIQVSRVVWENIRYEVNDQTKEIERRVVGEFEQYPLKLAWAITIHKSQGLTFERAIIDAKSAFAHGQVYVALSRCKTLEGLVLSTPISNRGLNMNEEITEFTRESEKNQPSQEILDQAKVSYQQKLISECFDCSRIQRQLDHFVGIIAGNQGVIRVAGVDNIRRMQSDASEIFKVSEIFKKELDRIFQDNQLPESHAHLLERISKGSVWFEEKLNALLTAPLQNIILETDNRELEKKLGIALNNLKQELCVKLAGIKCCEKGFSPYEYLRAVSSAEIDFEANVHKKKPKPEYSQSDLAHPVLFETLKSWRSTTARELNMGPHRIIHLRTLIQIAMVLPDSLGALRRIHGIGRITLQKFGTDILAMVRDYRDEKGIYGDILPESTQPSLGSVDSAKTKALPSTKDISFDKFRKGLTVKEIAEERGLAVFTIEGHLAYFIEKGKLCVDEVVGIDKRKVIEQKLAENNSGSLNLVKYALGPNYSYGEIKMVLAHSRHKKV